VPAVEIYEIANLAQYNIFSSDILERYSKKILPLIAHLKKIM